ncbi:MAG: ATP-binding cassette domain-containing protein [Coriobacteriia bacterium]|nr:ATP-binding cassette domain-containing protein [Coriobacteriia bacterium]MCL2606436.1 ATP-binding cassette domain-containing protein [Coriobacteriia bacterium]
MQITDLQKQFDGKIVTDIPSLAIELGASYVLWGANGTGKSTFLRLLAGILTSDSGTIEDPLSISYQPQHPYIFKMSCLQNVMLGLHEDRENDACEMLDCLGLAGQINASATSLSGGQLQRMFLARSLLGNSELLLLDEPFAAIDSDCADEIVRFTLAHCKEKGRTLMAAVNAQEHRDILGEYCLFFSSDGQVQLHTSK